jgi:hypothetical protein
MHADVAIATIAAVTGGVRLVFDVFGSSAYSVMFLIAKNSSDEPAPTKVLLASSGYISGLNDTVVMNVGAGNHFVILQIPDSYQGHAVRIQALINYDNVLDRMAAEIES